VGDSLFFMADKIEKPWAVYGTFVTEYLGKIRTEGKVFDIRNSDTDSNPNLWDSSFVKQFKTSLEAINYFFPNSEYKNDKKRLIQNFLSRFPSEKTNLENLITQSSP
jgi:hypothetical protein